MSGPFVIVAYMALSSFAAALAGRAIEEGRYSKAGIDICLAATALILLNATVLR